MSNETDDKIALRELVDVYSTGVTTCDAKLIGSVFTDNGEWRVSEPLNMHISGRDNIGAGIAAGLASFHFMVQMVHSVMIDLQGDRATLRCTMQEVGRAADGTPASMLGIYDDAAVRTANGWRFSSRIFKPIYLDPTPLTGQSFKIN